MTVKDLALRHLDFIKEQLDRALDVCTDVDVPESYKVGYSKGSLEVISDIIADVEHLVNEIPYPFT